MSSRSKRTLLPTKSQQQYTDRRDRLSPRDSSRFVSQDLILGGGLSQTDTLSGHRSVSSRSVARSVNPPRHSRSDSIHSDAIPRARRSPRVDNNGPSISGSSISDRRTLNRDQKMRMAREAERIQVEVDRIEARRRNCDVQSQASSHSSQSLRSVADLEPRSIRSQSTSRSRSSRQIASSRPEMYEQRALTSILSDQQALMPPSSSLLRSHAQPRREMYLQPVEYSDHDAEEMYSDADGSILSNNSDLESAESDQPNIFGDNPTIARIRAQAASIKLSNVKTTLASLSTFIGRRQNQILKLSKTIESSCSQDGLNTRTLADHQASSRAILNDLPLTTDEITMLTDNTKSLNFGPRETKEMLDVISTYETLVELSTSIHSLLTNPVIQQKQQIHPQKPVLEQQRPPTSGKDKGIRVQKQNSSRSQSSQRSNSIAHEQSARRSNSQETMEIGGPPRTAHGSETLTRSLGEKIIIGDVPIFTSRMNPKSYQEQKQIEEPSTPTSGTTSSPRSQTSGWNRSESNQALSDTSSQRPETPDQISGQLGASSRSSKHSQSTTPISNGSTPRKQEMRSPKLPRQLKSLEPTTCPSTDQTSSMQETKPLEKAQLDQDSRHQEAQPLPLSYSAALTVKPVVVRRVIPTEEEKAKETLDLKLKDREQKQIQQGKQVPGASMPLQKKAFLSIDRVANYTDADTFDMESGITVVDNTIHEYLSTVPINSESLAGIKSMAYVYKNGSVVVVPTLKTSSVIPTNNSCASPPTYTLIIAMLASNIPISALRDVFSKFNHLMSTTMKDPRVTGKLNARYMLITDHSPSRPPDSPADERFLERLTIVNLNHSAQKEFAVKIREELTAIGYASPGKTVNLVAIDIKEIGVWDNISAYITRVPPTHQKNMVYDLCAFLPRSSIHVPNCPIKTTDKPGQLSKASVISQVRTIRTNFPKRISAGIPEPKLRTAITTWLSLYALKRNLSDEELGTAHELLSTYNDLSKRDFNTLSKRMKITKTMSYPKNLRTICSSLSKGPKWVSRSNSMQMKSRLFPGVEASPKIAHTVVSCLSKMTREELPTILEKEGLPHTEIPRLMSFLVELGQSNCATILTSGATFGLTRVSSNEYLTAIQDAMDDVFVDCAVLGYTFDGNFTMKPIRLNIKKVVATPDVKSTPTFDVVKKIHGHEGNNNGFFNGSIMVDEYRVVQVLTAYTISHLTLRPARCLLLYKYLCQLKIDLMQEESECAIPTDMDSHPLDHAHLFLSRELDKLGTMMKQYTDC